jgi:hypothetical protein
MPLILYEIRGEPDTEWRILAKIRSADPPGSVIDTTYDRCDVLLFGCGGSMSSVSRTVDTTNNPHAAMTDVIRRGRMEPLCQLYDRESFELEIKTTDGKVYQARWTHYNRYIPGWTSHA